MNPDLSQIPQTKAKRALVSALLRRGFVLALVVLGAFLVVRIGAALWLRSYLDDPAADLSKATGMDESIAAWLRGVALTVGSLSVVPWLLRWGLGLVLPGFDTARTAKLSIVALGISGLAVCSAPFARAIRGVDRDGLPREMQAVDPETARWFDAGGHALIFVSTEQDGSHAFWNRPGATPYTGTTAEPATPDFRTRWETARKARLEQESKQRDEAQRRAREKVERASKQLELQIVEQRAKREQASREAELSAELVRKRAELDATRTREKRLDEEKSALRNRISKLEKSTTPPTTRPVSTRSPTTTPPSRVQRIPTPGRRTTGIRIRGDAVEIWADGPIRAGADGRPMQDLPPGRHLRFRAGFHSLGIAPRNPTGTTVYIRKLP